MFEKNSELPFAIALCGPTGCGKTALAVKLAVTLNCEIINADSRQLYADFPIITAQPDAVEQGGVVHHLYGMLALEEKLDAASWCKLAAGKAHEIARKGKLPLFVGGSGFYIRALFEGLAYIPAIEPAISQKIKQEMDSLGVKVLYSRLSRNDPELARKIHPHDRQRIMRGLEVLESTGRCLSSWQANPPLPYCRGLIFFKDADLNNLTPILRKRIVGMLEAGASAEAKRAFERCGNLKNPGWSAVGCKEALALALGKTTYEDCVAGWHIATRAYAKRQLTWFRGRQGYVRLKNDSEFFMKTLIKACPL